MRDTRHTVAFLVVAAFALLAIRCASCNPRYDDAERRNVLIQIVAEDGKGTCSGVILQTGLVLTAQHCYGTSLTIAGHNATVLAQSKDNDLMLLRVQTAEFPPLIVAAMPFPGDGVYVVGHYSGWENLLSIGKVMAVRDGDVWSSVISAPGFSGSALYNDAGELQGINTQLRGWKDEFGVGHELYAFTIGPRKVAAFLKLNGY